MGCPLFSSRWNPSSLRANVNRQRGNISFLENDPSVISPDVVADDRAQYEATGDQKYVDKVHRRGKLGWDDRA